MCFKFVWFCLILIAIVNVTKAIETVMINSMDKSQNPCENFYMYACGNWPKEEDAPKDTPNYVLQQYKKKLAAGLETRRKDPEKESNEVYQKTRDYYEACREIENFDALRYFKVLERNEKTMNWLNIIENQNLTISNDWNWWKELGKLRKYNFQGVFLGSSASRVGRSRYVLDLYAPSKVDFGGVDRSILQSLDKEMKTKIVEFKLKLETIAKEHSETDLTTVKLQEFEADEPFLDIRGYLTALLETELNDEMLIRINNLNFLKSTQELISQTPKNIVAFFMALKFAEYLRAQLPKSNEPMDCINHMNDPFTKAFELIFAEQFSNLRGADIAIDNIFRALKKQILKVITDHDQDFSNETLKFLQEKIVMIGLTLDGSNEDLVETSMNFFKNLNIEKTENDAFYSNSLNVLQDRAFKRLNLLEVPIVFKPLTTGYNPEQNLIMLPQFLLQSPIFDKDSTISAQFGSLGKVIAIEIFNAFDLYGIFYDAYSNITKVDLSKSELDTLEEIQKCISKFVYEAYLEHMKKVGTINLSDKETFFTSYMQVMCTSSTEKEEFKEMQHQVQANDDFFKVYNCTKAEGQETCQS